MAFLINFKIDWTNRSSNLWRFSRGSPYDYYNYHNNNDNDYISYEYLNFSNFNAYGSINSKVQRFEREIETLIKNQKVQLQQQPQRQHRRQQRRLQRQRIKLSRMNVVLSWESRIWVSMRISICFGALMKWLCRTVPGWKKFPWN